MVALSVMEAMKWLMMVRHNGGVGGDGVIFGEMGVGGHGSVVIDGGVSSSKGGEGAYDGRAQVAKAVVVSQL